MNESAPPAPERSWQQLRISTLLSLTAMVAAALAGGRLAYALAPMADDMWLWLDLALFVSGPVSAATLLWIGGRFTSRFVAVGVLLFAVALSPLVLRVRPPNHLVLAMTLFQYHQDFLTFCATIGAVGAVLERMSTVRVLLGLASSFMSGYLIGTAAFDTM